MKAANSALGPCVILFLACVVQLAGPGAAGVLRAEDGEIHVGPGGNDNAKGDAAQPFATPARALQAAARLAGKSPDARLRVVFQAGVYRIDKPLLIGRQHAPAAGSLTLAAAPGAGAVISGGRLIQGWKVREDGAWTVSVPPAMDGKWTFRELFVSGERRPRARHPNRGYLRIDEAFPDKRSGFTFAASDLPTAWTGGGELVFLHDWSLSRIDVKSVDHSRRRLTAADPIGNRADHYQIDHFEKHPRYYVENHRALLDAPGEWFLDESSGVLAYLPLPGENPRVVQAIAPLATSLVVIAGDEEAPIRNVHFQGLSFEHCAWRIPPRGYAGSQATAHERRAGDSPYSRNFIPPAIRLEQAEDCSFRRCRLAHLGGSGIEFGSRTRRCQLANCVIDDVSGNGVNLGEDAARLVGNRRWWQAAPQQTAAAHVVEHNRIERCGQQFFGAVAVWVGLAREMRIAHNEIAQHPYTGVSLGWMWDPTPTPAGGNVVERNHIHHVMQVLSDGGGIYTLGRQPGMRLAGNVIHDVPLNAGRAESNGMFLDEGSDQLTIADNVIYNIDRSPLRFHRAQQITVRGNLLVVRDKEMPPLRYNNTDPGTVEQIQNRILTSDEFDPATVPLPESGPRSAP